MSVNYLLLSLFSFNQDTFLPITVALVLLSVGLHYFLSSSIIDPLLKSDDAMKKTIKETLHELNTPVSTIAMNTKMIQKNCEDEKTLKRLSRIQKSCDDLLEMYNSMEYSIKKQIDNIEIVEFNLLSCINSSREKFEDIKKDISIINDIHSALMIKTDKKGFQKVIDNLLSNAIKYNHQNGSIEISIEDSWLNIVNDGQAIDTKNLLIIFDEHYQEDRKSTGFGLGLSIVKEFCDQHKIEVKIISIDNKTMVKLNLNNVLMQTA
ncbi:MAG: HAMP domain-containing sensor histidine kinase [Campylobacterota bacterium]|nr:HAMP domain-containing sensor histidine kinase [Campylobacterota bacterium]